MRTVMTMHRLGMALSIALGGLATIPSISFAQDLELRLGPNGVRPVIRDRERDREYGRRGGCSPSQALAAARDEGFRRPEVVRVTDRSVVVQGMTRSGPDRITFANRRGCPEL